jgi:hypothetical protein
VARETENHPLHFAALNNHKGEFDLNIVDSLIVYLIMASPAQELWRFCSDQGQIPAYQMQTA